MATETEAQFRHELAMYHGGLVVLDREGNYDAETTAEIQRWLVGDRLTLAA